MNPNESPYVPPTPSDRDPSRVPSFVLLPLIGGAVGFVGYIGAALAIEELNPIPEGAVILSYGQQAGLISLPICTLMGLGIGFSISFARVRQLMIAGALLLIVAALSSFVVLNLWNSQIAAYGRDRSEMVLYYPPMAMCGIAVSLALMLFAISARRIIRLSRAG